MLGQGFVEPWEGVTGGWWVHLGTSGAGLQPGHRSCTLPCPRTGRNTSFPLLRSLWFQSGRRLGWGVNKAGDGRDAEKEVWEQRRG